MDLHYLPSIVPATAPILVGLLFLFHLLWKQRFSRRTPPEAGGAWPIIGHLHLLAGPQPPHITLGHMADKHGPIFTIKMGIHRALVVSSWEMAKECLTTNDKIFANRPKAAGSEHMTYNYAMFGFSPYGPYWRQVRKIATLELLSNHRLQMLSHVRVSEVNTAIKEIYEVWVKNNNSGNNNNGVGVEMKKWFGDITLNVIFRMVVGKRYLEATSLSEIGSDDRCRKALRDFFELTGTFVVSDALPYLKWLDFGGYEKAMKKTSKELDQLAQRWLEEHKRKRVSGEVNGAQDFMDVMLSILDGAELGISSTYDADTINKATSLVCVKCYLVKIYSV